MFYTICSFSEEFETALDKGEIEGSELETIIGVLIWLKSVEEDTEDHFKQVGPYDHPDYHLIIKRYESLNIEPPIMILKPYGTNWRFLYTECTRHAGHYTLVMFIKRDIGYGGTRNELQSRHTIAQLSRLE